MRRLIADNRTLDLAARGLAGAVVAVVAVQFALTAYVWATDYNLDAQTYLWAAERLNTGNELYAIGPGDHPMRMRPPDWEVPFLSPPAMAVVWRPFALLSEPWSLGLWYTGVFAAVLGTVAYILRNGGAWSLLTLIALAPAIGEQLVMGNVNAYLVSGFVIVWLGRRSDLIGLPIGVMVALKLTPAVLLVWLVGQRRLQAFALALAATIVVVFVGILGAGPESTLEYMRLVPTFSASPLSPARLLGIPWLTWLIVVAGLSGILLLRRHPRASFVAAASTAVLGSPSLYVSSLVGVLPAIVSVVDSGRRFPSHHHQGGGARG